MKFKSIYNFEYLKDNDDKRQICQYCYNEDTKRITDFTDLQPYKDYYKERPFVAYSCYCRNSKWHYAVEIG